MIYSSKCVHCTLIIHYWESYRYTKYTIPQRSTTERSQACLFVPRDPNRERCFLGVLVSQRFLSHICCSLKTPELLRLHAGRMFLRPFI